MVLVVLLQIGAKDLTVTVAQLHGGVTVTFRNSEQYSF